MFCISNRFLKVTDHSEVAARIFAPDRVAEVAQSTLREKWDKALTTTPEIKLLKPVEIAPKKSESGYRLPNFELLDASDTTSDGRVPLQVVDSRAVKAYLHGNGKNDALPPIAKDFMQVGLNLVKKEEAADSSKPQIHVSTRAGISKFPLGSEQNPYTSIQAAIEKAPSGSVINVHRVGQDVFKERISINRSGLVLKTDRDNPAIIDLQNVKGADAAIAIGSGVKDIGVRNFEIRNFSGRSAGISIEGANIENITISGNNIHSAQGSEAIRVYGRGITESSKVKNVKILANEIHNLKLGELEAIPINGNVSDFKVIGNAGYKLDNIFIDAIGGEKVSANKMLDQARHGQIEFNYANGVSTLNNQNSRESGKFSAAAIYSDGARNLSIRNNYIKASDFGIEVGSEHRAIDSSRVEVSGNIVEDSKYVWLGRGGDPSRPGGARDSFARNNILIGNDKNELQSNVSNFPVNSNPDFKDISKVTQLPKPIATLLQRFSRQ